MYIGPPATAPNTPGTTNVLIALSRIANLAPAQLVYAGTLVCFGPFDEGYGPLNTSCN